MKKTIILIASAAVLITAGTIFAFTYQTQNSETKTATTPAVSAKSDECCMKKDEAKTASTDTKKENKDACCAAK